MTKQTTPSTAGARGQSHPELLPSKAAIAGHPIHPMLIPFPIASFVLALLTDIGYWSTGDPFWARASMWLLGVGVVSGVLAAITGAVDFYRIPRVRALRAGWAHAIGNAVALALAVINLFLRVGDPVTAVVPAGFILSLLTAALLGVTGWYGGELSYRHRIGVFGRGSEPG